MEYSMGGANRTSPHATEDCIMAENTRAHTDTHGQEMLISCDVSARPMQLCDSLGLISTAGTQMST